MAKTIDGSKPFLRWAGGKSWLIKYLDSLIPPNGYKNYHEPFLGGGSIFFSINSHNAYLSDLNEELIVTYNALKNDPEGIIKILKKYNNTEEFYYRIRDNQFSKPLELAARFIYLNQTSFNGIYRVNLKGQYNVPYGYRKKDFLDAELLRSVSKKLRNASIFHSDFSKTKNNIRKGDLVFLDPPYTVSHNNNGFIKYNQKLFSLEDQYRLSEFIDFIKSKNAYYILTNAAHKTVEEIFDKDDRKIKLNRANIIGGQKAERGIISEFIFTNVENAI